MVYWQYGKLHREPPARRKLIDSRRCPECSGFLQRIAQRDHVYPYRWNPIGFRCIDCQSAYVDSEHEI